MSRRGPGEGTIYQREDGRWEGIVTIGYQGGKRHRKSVYGKTRREVQDRLDAIRRDLTTGLAPAGERLTLGAYLDRWIDDVRPKLRPRTHKRYSDLLRLHVTPTLGHLRLSRLTPQDVQRLLTAKLDSGLSPQTVVHIRAVLRRALRDALRFGLVARNVATLVDPPRVERHEVRAVTPAEARAVLEAVKADRLGALYALALATGLRQGEALGLRWEDVDLDTATLRVRQTVGRIDGRLQFAEPKTTLSRRTIGVPGFIVGLLREHRKRQLEDRLLAGDQWQDLGLIFTATVGTPLDGAVVTRRLQGLLAAAQLPRMRFHDLRHACASLLLAQGVHPRVVMETLGHSTIALTMNTYSHVIPQLQREAADRLDSLLAGS